MSNRTPAIPRDQSVLHRALALTRKSLDRDAAPLSPADMAWLFARPTVWLRAVQIIKNDTERRARDATAAIKALRGGNGAPVPEEYAEAKAEYDRTRKARATFLTILNAYLEEVKAIVGPQALHAGDVISALTQAAELIDDGDTDAGLDMLLAMIEKWGQEGAALRAPQHLIIDTNTPQQ